MEVIKNPKSTTQFYIFLNLFYFISLYSPNILQPPTSNLQPYIELLQFYLHEYKSTTVVRPFLDPTQCYPVGQARYLSLSLSLPDQYISYSKRGSYIQNIRIYLQKHYSNSF